MQINKRLLFIKVHYFLWNAGTAPVVPFMSVYARQLGFSSVIVGIVYMIIPIAGMIAKPSMGILADRYKCQKLIFLIAQLITAFAFLSIFYVPSLPIHEKMHFSCDNSVANLRICFNKTGLIPESLIKSRSNKSIKIMVDCPMQENYWHTVCNKWNVQSYCKDHPERFLFQAHVPYRRIIDINNCLYFEVENASVLNNIHKPICSNIDEKMSAVCNVKDTTSPELNSIMRTVDDEDVVDYYQFWLFLILMIIAWVGQAVVVSVGDTICFELLENNPHNYGKQRSYGALGWGIFSIIAGYMVDSFSNNTGEKYYLSVFYLAFGVLILDFITSTRLKYVQKNLSTTILRDVGRLLKNVRILIFIVWCVAVGLCTGVIWNFLLWLLQDLATAYSEDSSRWITTLQGFAMAIQCLAGELPFFFLSSWILKRIGHVNAMTLILAVIGVRYILYSIIVNPWLALPIEILNGITFGLAYASMASYACVIAPPGTSTTVQGLTGAIFEGVGVSVGSLVGGILYKDYGGSMMFRIFGIGSLIACLLHALVQYLVRNRDLDKDALEYATPQEALSMVCDDYQELRIVN